MRTLLHFIKEGNYGFKFIATVIILLSGLIIKSQDYIPTLRDDAVWTIGRGQGMGAYRYFDVRLLSDSIMIDNLSYRLISIGALEDDCAPELGYVREDIGEKRVYYRSSLEDSPYYTEEVLIADYSLSVGDSIWVPDWGIALYVDSVYMKPWFDGQEYKYFQLDNPHFSFYEGLGSQLYGVVPECHVYCFLFGYEHADIETNTSVSVSSDFDIACYPNPVSELLTIKWQGVSLFEQIEVSITDLTGKEYLFDELRGKKAVLDLGQFPSGVLIVSFYQNGRFIEAKRISHF
ncbi:MAG: T9SS type A sorting domain-containing protein [Lewinella sp.]|uniref:T9SS type A sorting domain-containing protein n=1 Tax=Lewinella sp. TaxID=2004506 RepID=UPI003D6ACA5A